MYGCESWTVKKAECRRIGAFELWCWRLLRVPWTARRSNQSILKEISPGCSLEGLMLKLKLQYFGYLMRRVDSLEKTLMLGGIGGRRTQEDSGWDTDLKQTGRKQHRFLQSRERCSLRLECVPGGWAHSPVHTSMLISQRLLHCLQLITGSPWLQQPMRSFMPLLSGGNWRRARHTRRQEGYRARHLPGGSVESEWNPSLGRRPWFNPGLRRSPGGGHGNPL